MTRQDVLDQARSLSKADQIALAMELIDLLAPGSNTIDLTEAQKHEIDRRIQLHDADPSRALPWEAVRARLLRKA